MKNVFHQLFDEDLSRVNLMFEKGTPYEDASNRLVAEEEKLLATLNAEKEQLLRAYSKAESDVFDLARREDFAAGVKLGARLILAILDDTPAMVHPEPPERKKK